MKVLGTPAANGDFRLNSSINLMVAIAIMPFIELKTITVMKKQILDVGNCGPDHASIHRMLEANFDMELHQADQLTDAIRVLNSKKIDLVLVNRKLDIDYSDGIDIIRQLKQSPQYSSIPMMLITNYDEHQQAAMELGAVRGFGKLELSKPETIERLSVILGDAIKK